MGLVLAGAPDKSAADPADASQFRRVDTVFIFDLPISLPWFAKKHGTHRSNLRTEFRRAHGTSHGYQLLIGD
jgi:hypothetical protein